jgi:hypothetical protein
MIYRMPQDCFSGVEQSYKNVGTCCIRDARRRKSGATGAERTTRAHPSLFRLAHALIPRMTPGQLPPAAWRGTHQDVAPATHAQERDYLHN